MSAYLLKLFSIVISLLVELISIPVTIPVVGDSFDAVTVNAVILVGSTEIVSGPKVTWVGLSEVVAVVLPSLHDMMLGKRFKIKVKV